MNTAKCANGTCRAQISTHEFSAPFCATCYHAQQYHPPVQHPCVCKSCTNLVTETDHGYPFCQPCWNDEHEACARTPEPEEETENNDDGDEVCPHCGQDLNEPLDQEDDAHDE